MALLSSLVVLQAQEETESALSKQLGIEEYLTLSGSANVFYQTMPQIENNTDRDEFGYAYLFLKGETVEWNGFQLGATGMFNGEFNDHNETYERLVERNDLLAEAYLRYTYSETTFTLGREAKDWLMLGDFFEGVFIESRDLEDFLIRAAWVDKVAVFDPDEVTDYEKLNDSDGVFGAEITYEGIENFTATGLYYNAPDAYEIYGGQLTLDIPVSDDITNSILVEYYATNEDSDFADYPDDDGSIFHISNTLSIQDLSVTLGYIEAANNAGAGNLLNNPWDPFEEDSHTDRPGAETWYLSAEYQLTEDLMLGAIYGESQTDDGTNSDASFREFNFLVSYGIIENLTLDLAYVTVESTDGVEEGFDKVWMNLVYEF